MIINIPNPDMYSHEVCPWCASDVNRTPSALCLFILTCINPHCGKATNGFTNSIELEKIFYEEHKKGNHKTPVKYLGK